MDHGDQNLGETRVDRANLNVWERNLATVSEVKVGGMAGCAMLTVCDDGKGMVAADIGRFESEHARTRTRPGFDQEPYKTQNIAAR